VVFCAHSKLAPNKPASSTNEHRRTRITDISPPKCGSYGDGTMVFCLAPEPAVQEIWDRFP
jgi:hypothetical protein